MSVQCRVRACSSFPRSARARASHIPERESLLFLLWSRFVPRAPLYSSLSLSSFLPSPSTPLLYPYLLSIRLSVYIYVSPPLLSFSFFLSLSLSLFICIRACIYMSIFSLLVVFEFVFCIQHPPCRSFSRT